MIEHQRGSIIAEEAYALGKMLDNSSWQTDEPRLPRRITPADVDFPRFPLVFDNRGVVMLCELSRIHTEWHQLSIGQRWLYSSIISHEPHFSVLCTHNITPEQGRKINTRYDVQSFQVMIWDHGGCITSKVMIGNRLWQNFVLGFYNERAIEFRRTIIGKSIEQDG